MRVAILSPVAWRTPPRHYGPWEQVASDITEELVKKGLDVTLFATGDSITKAKLSYCIPNSYSENQSADAKVSECLHISQLMERADEFDIIHNHYDFLPLTYSRLISTPMITTIHGFSSPKIIEVYRKYNSTSHYISISESNRHHELTYHATIYNGVNTSKLDYNEHPSDYLLFFGRIHPEKGTLEAIELARRCGKKLIIAGFIQDDGYYHSKISPLIDNNRVIYAGNCGPVRRNYLMKNAAALIHLVQFDEPFGLSVAEAMCCGTPVIAYNRGAMPELIKNGKTGYVVKNMNEAVYAVTQLKYIRRADCHEWATKMFSRERMGNDYIKAYTQVLKDR